MKYLERVLYDEYSVKSLERPTQGAYLFIKELKTWVPAMSVYLGCRDVALDISSMVDLSKVLDYKKTTRKARNAKRRGTLDGSNVTKCLIANRDGVLNKMVNLGLEKLMQDREFTQAELIETLAQANVKLPKSNKIQYSNVVEEFFAIKDAVSFHQIEMKEIKNNWIWSDNSFSYENDFELYSPPLRNSMLDYLIEMDNLNR